METIVIAIVNRKGGVGKTTTAKNLSYSLALMNKKVLLIDLDPQCNSTKGLSSRNFNNTVNEVLENGKLKRCIYSLRFGFDIVPGNQLLASHQFDENTLSYAINSIKGEYDYIIIDSSPYFNELTAELLLCSDEVIIPTEVEVDALDAMTTTIAELDTLNNGKTKYTLLFTKVTNLKTVHDDINELDSIFKSSRFKTIIRYHSYAVTRARKLSLPLAKKYKKASVTKDYLSLAKEIAGGKQ